MFKLLSIFVVVLFVQVVLSQNPVFEGPCPNVKGVQTFNLKDFMGVWFGYYKYPYPQVLNRKCIQAKYTEISNTKITVDGSGVDLTTMNVTRNHWQGDVVGVGEFIIYYNKNQTERNFKVMGTDYKNWAFAYNCRNVANENKHTYEVYCLSRKRTLASGDVAKCNEIMKANKIDQSFIEYYDQKNCPANQ